MARHGKGASAHTENSMDHQAKTYSGGLPVGPDIRALNEAFPDLKAGTAISYDDIGAVIGATWREGRFWRVLNAWRESLEPTGRLTKCAPGKALVVLTDDLAIGHIYDETGVAKRKVRKTGKRAAYIRPKDEISRLRADHAREVLAKLAHVMEVAQRRLQVPKTLVLPSAAHQD